MKQKKFILLSVIFIMMIFSSFSSVLVDVVSRDGREFESEPKNERQGTVPGILDGNTRASTPLLCLENVSLDFPEGGGIIDSHSIHVPTDAYIANASMFLEGELTYHQEIWEYEEESDYISGEAENISIGDQLRLQELTKMVKNSTDWEGSDFNHTGYHEGNVSLVVGEEVRLVDERRADVAGVYDNQRTDCVDMVVDGNGTLHLVYVVRNGDAVYQRSMDGGVTWTIPVSLTAPINNLIQVSIFVSPAGALHFFSEEQLMGGSTLIHKYSSDAGVTWVEGTLPLAGMGVRQPRIVWDSSGNIHGIGRMNVVAPPFPTYLRYFNSTDNGRTWNGPVLINDSEYANPPIMSYDLAVDGNGVLHAIWSDCRDYGYQCKQIYYSNSSDGDNWLPNRNIFPLAPVDMQEPEIEITSDNRLHLLWSDNTTGKEALYYSNSSDGGGNFSPPKQFCPQDLGSQSASELMVSADDTIHVAWAYTEGRDSDIYYSNSTDHIQFLSSLRVHNQTGGEQLDPALALTPDGRPYFAWNDARAGPPQIYVSGISPVLVGQGSISGTFDMHIQPFYLGAMMLSVNGTQDTDVELKVCSSVDGFDWSDWETILPGNRPASTPPARYLNWNMVLTTSDPLVSPKINLLSLEYKYYHSEGQYISPVMEVEQGETGFILNWTLEGVYGNVNASLLDDVGTWNPVQSGGLVVLNGSSMRYRLDIQGTSNSTPVIKGVTLEQLAERIPTDLEVDMGRDGSVDTTQPGKLYGNTTIDFTHALREAVEDYMGIGDMKYWLKFTSATAGRLYIPRIEIVLDQYPILVDTFPSGFNPRVFENETARFSVNVTDPDDPVLEYQWTLDSVNVSAESFFNYTPFYGDSGDHVLAVNISDAHTTISYVWNVEVLRTNRPVALVSRQPIGSVLTEFGATVHFSVNALDPDGDDLKYSWKLDGKPIGTNLESLSLNTSVLEGPGNYTVSVDISDGEASTNTLWALDVWQYLADVSLDPEILKLLPGESAGVTVVLSNNGQLDGVFQIIFNPGPLGNGSLFYSDVFELGPGYLYNHEFNVTALSDSNPGKYDVYFMAVRGDTGSVLFNVSLSVEIYVQSSMQGDDDSGSGSQEVVTQDDSWDGFMVVAVVVLLLLALLAGILSFVLWKYKNHKTDRMEPLDADQTTEDFLFSEIEEDDEHESPAGGDMTGGDMAGGDMAGGDMTGGDMAGDEMAGGDMTGGDMAGGDITNTPRNTTEPTTSSQSTIVPPELPLLPPNKPLPPLPPPPI